ncbi:hypothetical protein FC70_GL000075 [Paucilactobacillus oligofermentans DSM 15707 = LMG 22743]|uniref:IpaB EvcA family protein n=1 Tax=Paucilactobacillus oligofermentans DSM 15707 = LMG 22743 TaxID=1423778 RepID=A0A0R1RYE4_9LACO|nr:hypothetical protein [Paucilactobacillus oligofermentans]KRL58187.1 hypothetical protein FC70_GL000075 [Paucilactobacillus oligofermentans DSM 15707 = LMG 22743]CUS26897.1 Uncharacterized protein LACOL_1560 [Paucilactobacillus oligofermentans DSM 15707 = LMG 22743]
MTIALNSTVEELLDQVNKIYPGVVLVHFGDEEKGYLRHDQAKQEALQGGIEITVTDVTAPNYTASHELLHLLMIMQGFPQIFFQVSFGDEKLDEQLMIMATDLYDVAMHVIVVDEQRKHNLIDSKIEALYIKGVDETLTPEIADNDDERTLRLLTLLDTCVFMGERIDTVATHLSELYPLAFKAAQTMYRDLMAKPIDSPFTMRRAIVKLFKQFDQQLNEWRLPALHTTEFTTLSTVVSERQLRLETRQLFEVFHSEMINKETGEKAYIALQRSDHQNSFVVNAPKENTDTFFKEMYDKTVQELLEEMHVPYIVRK